MAQYYVKYNGKIVLAGDFKDSSSAKKLYKSHFAPSVKLSSLSARKIPKGYVLDSRDRSRTFYLRKKK